MWYRDRVELEMLKKRLEDHTSDDREIHKALRQELADHRAESRQSMQVVNEKLDNLLTDRDQREGAAHEKQLAEERRRHSQTISVSRFVAWATLAAGVLALYADRIWHIIFN